MPEYIPDLLDLGVVGEVHGPYRPVRLLEEAQARVGEGEVELVVFYIWRPVGVLHDVRVSHPGLAEVPRLHAAEHDRPLGSSGTEAVLVRREHRHIAQVQASRRVVCWIGGTIVVPRHVPLYQRTEVSDVASAVADERR